MQYTVIIVIMSKNFGKFGGQVHPSPPPLPPFSLRPWLCEYYVGGFDLLKKWMAKHHPDLDLSSLVMGDVEKELLSDRPFEATTEMEEATIVAEVMEEAVTTTPVDAVPDEQ